MGSRVRPASARVMIWGFETSISKPSRRIISMRMASCSSPRPDTRKVSGESVSSTRMPTLVRRSFHSRSRSWVEVTYLPSRPENGETLDEKSIDTVGSSTRISGQRLRPLGVGDGLADLHGLDAGHRHQVAGGRLRDLHPLEPLVAVEHRDLGDVGAPVAVQHRHPVVLADAPVDDAADDESAHVVVPVEGGRPELEPRLGREAGRGHRGEERVEERGQRARVVVEAAPGDALAGIRVDDREVELLVRGIQGGEEVERSSSSTQSGRAFGRSISLMTTTAGSPASSAFLRTKRFWGRGPSTASTRSRTPSTSAAPLDLAAEVGVARGVDDVDLHPPIVNRGILPRW